MTDIRRLTVRIAAMALILTAAIALIGYSAETAEVVSAASKSATVKKAKKGTKVTVGNYKYKITKLAKKKSTVSVLGLTKKAKKKLKKIVIPKTVKIRSKKGKNKGVYRYKVTAIANGAFKYNNKIRTVKIGDNVVTIGKKAFYKCSNLTTVTMGKRVRKIGKLAFGGCFNLIRVVIPEGMKAPDISDDAFSGCTKLETIVFDDEDETDDEQGAGKDNGNDSGNSDSSGNGGSGNDNGQNGGNGTGDNNGNNGDNGSNGSGGSGSDDGGYYPYYPYPETPEEPQIKATDYTYEVIPLVAPFGIWFYIKTDNPDPHSFAFVDKDTKYNENGGSIEPFDEEYFLDVKYENKDTKRVYGGYIALGSYTDGGELVLQQRKITGRHGVYDATAGGMSYQYSYANEDTDVSYTIPALKDSVDYLIDKYSDSSKSYFDNLSGIEAGFDRECMYSRSYVLGEEKKSEKTPFYGLSTSPHADQIFYIQDPYYRVDNKYLIMTQLYPLVYDSLGFPGVMSQIATELDSSAQVKWDSYNHYLVNVTYNGETQAFGGAGNGEGQGINEDQIIYRLSFDGSDDDVYKELAKEDTLEKAMNWMKEYGNLEVPEPVRDLEPLTWAKVRETVGKDGAYVRLIAINSIYGGSSIGYTYMYDDGSKTEGTNGWGAIGHFSNAWYDGHYFDVHEKIYKGKPFNEATVETNEPSIILKDPVIKLPDDGRK